MSNLWCFYWTKLQKLKAIHNTSNKSQYYAYGAFTEQNYKNWKQFTTQLHRNLGNAVVLLLNKITKIESNSQPAQEYAHQIIGCFYWTKLQKLKAIHNNGAARNTIVAGAFTEQNYKNWKQFTTPFVWWAIWALVLLLNKITKIESNSQQAERGW